MFFKHVLMVVQLTTVGLVEGRGAQKYHAYACDEVTMDRFRAVKESSFQLWSEALRASSADISFQPGCLL